VAGALRDRHGGIRGLLELLDEHQEAVEYDLIERGIRLRDIGPTFTWHDLAVIVRGLPQDSALTKSMLGRDYEWTTTNLLLAAAVDELRIANWQRSKDATRNNRPKPIPRPGVEPEKKTRKAVSVEEMREKLESKRHLSVVEDN
jgi:hypothetical protein